MKSTSTLFVSPLTLVLSWLVVSAALYYFAESRTSDFLRYQQQLSDQSVNSTVYEIETYIRDRRHLLTLLIADQIDHIRELAQQPGSEHHFTVLHEKVKSYFPEMVNFTLADARGRQIVINTLGFVGNACSRDIRNFSRGVHLNEIFVHSNPHPDAYHIDILQKIPQLNEQGDGIFFVSLNTSSLQRLLLTGQPYQHRFLLTRPGPEGTVLVDLSDRGTWVAETRSQQLEAEELAGILTRAPVPGSKWELLDIPDKQHSDAVSFSMRQAAYILFFAFVVISGIFFMIYRRSENKRLAHESEIVKLNESLQRTIQQRTTQLEQSRQLLSYQSAHDSLTGLKNRREFEISVGQTIAQVQQDPEHEAVVMYIDIDHFKIINETCGFAAGDEMIKQVARSLSGLLRRNDILARIGGDEFGIIVDGCELVQAELIGNTICQQISVQSFIWDGRKFEISASVGVAEIEQAGDDVSDVMGRVDSACFAAKEAGRNRVHVYHADDTRFQNRRSEMYWAGEALRLLHQDQLVLFGQRIAAVSANEVGDWYEVLVRMRGKDQELIFPDRFIPALERYGGIEKLDRHIVAKAVEFLKDHPRVRLNVNLSGKTIGDEGFLEHVQGLLEANAIDPTALVFEITETVTMSNIRQAMQFIDAIKRQGCGIALDDFGSGMSSFAYLNNLNVDYVKLDGSFVRDLDEDPVHYAMVRSINEVSEVMGKVCIAEFVENQSIVRKLREIGVAYAQGYEIHKPQDLGEIEFSATTLSNGIDFQVS